MTNLKELRERRIVQIILGYAAAGWILLEVCNALIERGMLPEFIYPTLFGWYLLGLLAAAIIGWYHGERGNQKAPPLEIALLSALAVVGLVFGGARVSEFMSQRAAYAAAAESSMDLRTVAVRYFEDASAGDDLRYLADGLTEDLIAELDRVGALDVISRHGVQPYRDNPVDSDSLARALDAGTVVEGSVESLGEKVRVNVRLVDGESGAEIQRAVFERPAEDVLSIREDLAEQVAQFLRSWIGEEVEVRQRERGTQDNQAWVLVQRAERAKKQMQEAFAEGKQDAGQEAYERADRLLSQAEVRDPEWTEPPTLRALLAYRRSRLSTSLPRIEEWIEEGIGHAERAIELDRTFARALEARGTLRYWKYILDLTPDPEARTALLGQARQDLEAAIGHDASLASAHSTLSHLYAQSDAPSAALAARRAYEEDAYLDVADEVLWRLFTLSWDMRQPNQAERWCEEGARRFPGDYRFVSCQLRLMTQPIEEANPERAWTLVQRLDELAVDRGGEWERVAGRMNTAAVLHRAGMPDSANAVLQRAGTMADPEVDPLQELSLWEAYIRTVMGQEDRAIALLRRYIAANPDHAFDPHSDLGWWWDPLRDHPEFSTLGTG